MTRTRKINIFAAAFIGIGIVLFTIGMFMGGNPGFYINSTGIHSQSEFNNNEPYILEKTSLDSFENIDIRMDSAELNIIPSDGYYLEYQVSGHYEEPVYSSNNGIFKFEENSLNASVVFNFFSWDFTAISESGSYYVNLYVPADTQFRNVTANSEDGNISIDSLITDDFICRMDYGNLSIQSIKAGNSDIQLDDGNFTFKEFQSDNVKFSGEYGKISGETWTSKTISCNLTDTSFSSDTLQADSLKLSTDYGNIRIGELNCTKSDISVEDGNFDAALGKVVELDAKSEYGNINLKLADKLDSYDADLRTSYGKIVLPDNADVISNDDDGQTYRQKSDKSQRLTVYCDDGNISLAY